MERPTLHFREFDIPENHALGLYRALNACRAQDAKRLVFDSPAVYALDPSFCAERDLCISNHGFNGPHRIAVLIEGRKNFEIDFGGSTLILPGEATHVAILGSEHITLRNLILENPRTMVMQVRVVAHGDGYVDTEVMQGGEQFVVRRGELVCPKPRRTCNYGVELDVELQGDTGEYQPGTASQPGRTHPGHDLRIPPGRQTAHLRRTPLPAARKYSCHLCRPADGGRHFLLRFLRYHLSQRDRFVLPRHGLHCADQP